MRKNILVTRGSSSVGSALARGFRASGRHIHATARTLAALETGDSARPPSLKKHLPAKMFDARMSPMLGRNGLRG